MPTRTARFAVSLCMCGSLPFPAMAPSPRAANRLPGLVWHLLCTTPPIPSPFPCHNSVGCRQLAARGQALLPYFWALLDCHATPGVADCSLVDPLAQWTLISAVQVLICFGEPVLQRQHQQQCQHQRQRQRHPAHCACPAPPRPAAALAGKGCCWLGQTAEPGRSCDVWLLLVNRARCPC